MQQRREDALAMFYDMMDFYNFALYFYINSYQVFESDSIAFSTVLSAFVFDTLTSAEMVRVCNTIKGKKSGSKLSSGIELYCKKSMCNFFSFTYTLFFLEYQVQEIIERVDDA